MKAIWDLELGEFVTANIPNLAEACVGRHEPTSDLSKSALHFDGTSLSYQQLASAVDFARDCLQPLVHPAQRVAILVPDSPAFVIAFLGAISAGAVAAPINPRFAAVDIGALLARLQPAVTIVHEQFADSCVSATEGIKTVVITCGDHEIYFGANHRKMFRCKRIQRRPCILPIHIRHERASQRGLAQPPRCGQLFVGLPKRSAADSVR